MIETLAEVERKHILSTLEHFNYNITYTARALDVSVRFIRNKCRQYQVEDRLPNGWQARRKGRGKGLVLKHPKEITLICAYCESSFVRKTSQYKDTTKKGQGIFFCCREHHGNYRFERSKRYLRRQARLALKAAK